MNYIQMSSNIIDALAKNIADKIEDCYFEGFGFFRFEVVTDRYTYAQSVPIK